MRSFRNINIMSYCNGTIRVADIINTIKTSMSEIGYSDEEIKKSNPGQNSLNEFYIEQNNQMKEEEIIDFTNEQSVINAMMKKAIR